METRIYHLPIENGIPIPKDNPYIKGTKKKSVRYTALDILPIGKSLHLRIEKLGNLSEEMSRYTAIISKHRKKLKWKFKFKTTAKCMIITRLG